MAEVFQIDIEKFLNSVYWTNVYFVNADNITSAAGAANIILGAERAITSQDVLFTKYRVSTVTENDNVFVTHPVNLHGQGTDDSDKLPLWNVVRVDFAKGYGRPCRKYLRIPLGEDQTINGSLTPAWASYVQTHYADPLVDMGICDKQGLAISSGLVFPSVAMHQLRRGSKRKTTPVI